VFATIQILEPKPARSLYQYSGILQVEWRCQYVSRPFGPLPPASYGVACEDYRSTEVGFDGTFSAWWLVSYFPILGSFINMR
jgi:hypothetical protein